jgi:hypothetical protein
MRWNRLFADLEAQLEIAEASELAAEVSDRTRRETSLLTIADRVAPALGVDLVVTCRGAGAVTGQVSEVGPDWLLMAEARGREVLVSTGAVVSISGLTTETEVQSGKVWRALDLCWALRGLARSRVAVQAVLCDGGAWTGTLDRVGADHVELAVHDVGEERRAAAVRQVVLLPVAAISVVRSL